MKNIFLAVTFVASLTFGADQIYNNKLEKERSELLNTLSVNQSQEIFESGTDNIRVEEMLYSENNILTDGVINLSEVGTQEFEIELYDFTERGERVSKSEIVTFTVRDTIAPTIEVEDIKMYEGEKPNYKIDILDTHCESDYYIDDSNVDFNKPGLYKAIVYATDKCGNSSDSEFTIEILSKSRTWVINTVSASFRGSQSVIDGGQTASVVSVFGEKWVFKHAYQGGSAWYGIKVGDVLVIDGVSYTVTLSQTAEQPTSINLYLNGVDIFAAETVSAGHKIIMKTCYSGTTNWVVTAD